MDSVMGWVIYPTPSANGLRLSVVLSSVMDYVSTSDGVAHTVMD